MSLFEPSGLYAPRLVCCERLPSASASWFGAFEQQSHLGHNRTISVALVISFHSHAHHPTTIMYGEKCVELIKEASRETTELIPAYNKTLVDEVVREMVTISQTLYQMLNSQPDLDADADRNTMDYRNRLLVNKVYLRAFLWNKRCLLAYHNHRLERLKKIRWEIGALLPNEVKHNISEDELQWFLKYSKNLADYMSRLNDNKGIDLTLMRNPPKKLYIQVRCNTEYGDLELDDGTSVILSKDSMHYLPLSKCEKLIHQGILEQIN